MISGIPPFETDSNGIPILAKVMEADFKFHPHLWRTISDEAQDLISKLIRKRPKDRLTCAEILQHPWFTGDQAAVTKAESLMAWSNSMRTESARFKVDGSSHQQVPLGPPPSVVSEPDGKKSFDKPACLNENSPINEPPHKKLKNGGF